MVDRFREVIHHHTLSIKCLYNVHLFEVDSFANIFSSVIFSQLFHYYESLEGSNKENKKIIKSRNYEIKSRNYEIKSRNYEIKSRNYEILKVVITR